MRVTNQGILGCRSILVPACNVSLYPSPSRNRSPRSNLSRNLPSKNSLTRMRRRASTKPRVTSKRPPKAGPGAGAGAGAGGGVGWCTLPRTLRRHRPRRPPPRRLPPQRRPNWCLRLLRPRPNRRRRSHRPRCHQRRQRQRLAPRRASVVGCQLGANLPRLRPLLPLRATIGPVERNRPVPQPRLALTNPQRRQRGNLQPRQPLRHRPSL